LLFYPNLIAQVSISYTIKKTQYETRFISISRLLFIDDLLTEEHKLVRDSAVWVKREVSPIIEEYAQKQNSKQILKV
jgi:hypothetical protein